MRKVTHGAMQALPLLLAVSVLLGILISLGSSVVGTLTRTDLQPGPLRSWGEEESETETEACQTIMRSLRPYVVAEGDTTEDDLFTVSALNSGEPLNLDGQPWDPKVATELEDWRNATWYSRLSIKGIDLEERTLALGLSVTATEEGLPNKEIPPGTRAFLHMVSPTGGGSRVEIDPAVLGGAPVVVDWELRLRGEPGEYPFDRYYSEVSSATLLITQPNGEYSQFYMDITGVGSRDSGGIEATAVPGFMATRSDKGGCWAPLYIGVTRDSALLYILAVLMIPLALFFVLAQSRSDDSATNGRALVELSVALIALLPLRAVLVPDAIGQVTLVDQALAFEVALLVGALAFGRSRGLRRSHSVNFAGEPGETNHSSDTAGQPASVPEGPPRNPPSATALSAAREAGPADPPDGNDAPSPNIPA